MGDAPGDPPPGADSEATDSERLLLRQREAWESGRRLLVEALVESEPSGEEDRDLLLDLIYHEILLREERGESCEASEYTRRFPELAADVRRQFEVHALMASELREDIERSRRGESSALEESGRAERSEESPAPAGPSLRPGDRVGRYRLVRELGRGGFGRVYLAEDPELERPVAIKIATAEGLGSEARLEMILAEARKMARLHHPHLVGVHDAVRTEAGACIVAEYVEGESLAERLQRGPLDARETIELLSRVCDAVHHAHQQGVVHRDLKPQNILLDGDGLPHVTDFGLAVAFDDARGGTSTASLAGSPAYMAPEQVRGEEHRIDPRTDVYALGAVLYQCLTGVPPFRAATVRDLFRAVREDPPPSLPGEGRQHDEIERICHRALAKRVPDRPASARALAEELRAARDVERRGIDTAVEGVPRGLRPFREEDHAFFLTLLPGPHDPSGLPASVSFWKQRIESRDEGVAFPVGLLYGPSGCGKSSLVRAGLLPALDPAVEVVHLEATPSETEARLAALVESSWRAVTGPSGESESEEPLSTEAGLGERVARLRRSLRGTGRKVLIVIDQIEQWLQAHSSQRETTELPEALRQMDGVHVQALLLGRDDFWLGLARLFREIEVPLREEHNARLYDLFDEAHARRVLERLGRAHGRLPRGNEPLDSEQRAFLAEAVSGLARDGRVVGIRLALLSEMMKRREWTLASLRSLGGVTGVGVLFLQRTVGRQASDRERRSFAWATQEVLGALLPGPGEDLKRAGLAGELRERSGLAPAAFARLVAILDRELHLIVPVEAVRGGGDTDEKRGGAVRYQIGHDFLVPAIRKWIRRERERTWRGRARLRLEEGAARWEEERDPRLLPGAIETVKMRWATIGERASPTQRAMLAAAGARHGRRASIALVVLAALALVGWRLEEWRREERTQARVDALVDAAPAAVPAALEMLRPDLQRARSSLRRAFQEPEHTPSQRLRAGFGLAAAGEPDPELMLELVPIVPAHAGTCRSVLRALREAPDAVPLIETHFAASRGDPELSARLATLLLFSGEPGAAEEILAPGPDPEARTRFLHGFPTWHGDLRSLPRVLAAAGGDVRGGVALALGLIDPRTLSPPVARRCVSWLTQTMVGADDAIVHVGCRRTLEQWGEEVPAVARTTEPTAGRGWFVTREGLTMVCIPEGTSRLGDLGTLDRPQQPPHDVTYLDPYWMSDREISVAHFTRFVEDPELPADARRLLAGFDGANAELSPEPECPVQQVTWYEAALFCNWLSGREGRKPCYRFELAGGADGGEAQTMVRVTCEFGANGYRLPTEAEWEYACRARTTTRHHFGDEARWLPEYARTSNLRRVPTFRGGRLLPNAWGVFDLHGNVWEWCQDWAAPQTETAKVEPRGPEEPVPPYGAQRIYRGGGIANSSGDPDSPARGFADPNARSYNLGFRVICAD